MTAADPFEYLEDPSDPRTAAWTAAQNGRTRAALDAIPIRAELLQRFDALLRVDAVGVPVVRGGRAFFTARRGTAEQTALFVRAEGSERMLIDPVAIDASGLTAIDWWFPSPRGTYVAFGLSKNGDERSTLYVLDVSSGERLSEAIADTRYCSLAWFADERGFFYTRHPPGGDYDVRAYRHELGAPSASDPLVFGEGRKPEEMLGLAISGDGRWLVASSSSGWARNDAYVADTSAAPLRFVTVAQGLDALFDVVPGNRALYVRTNDGAPRFALYEVDPANPARERWRNVVPETNAVLAGVALTRHAVALDYLENVRSVLRLRYADGSGRDCAPLAGSTLSAWSSAEDAHTLYALSASYFSPPVIQAFEIGERDVGVTVWGGVDFPIDTARYRVEQHWFASADGTLVPIDVLSSAGLPRDGSAPAIVYGYGGFNIPMLPGFSPALLPWLDAGGVYAIANIRGGGEFGDEWHRAGMLERKQNVFDDFIAAVDYLGVSGLADPARIGIFGGSNGGLLVAAVATQRPDLVRAVACAVPLTDMLRFHHYLIARLWIAEYGDPEVPEDAAILRAYSPYHRVRDGIAYPAMLIQTAESDTRVDPMHARKFAARVQAATGGTAPILLCIEPKAGHGVGKPRSKIVAELADRWAFLMRELGAERPTGEAAQAVARNSLPE